MISWTARCSSVASFSSTMPRPRRRRRGPPGRSRAGGRRPRTGCSPPLRGLVLLGEPAQLPPSRRGVSPYAMRTVPLPARRRSSSASRAIRTAWPVPSCSSWTASTASGRHRGCGDRPARAGDRRPHRPAGLEPAHRSEDVPDHAAAADGVQHLHRLGLHPGAAAGGQHDDGQLLGHAPSLRLAVSRPSAPSTARALPDRR